MTATKTKRAYRVLTAGTLPGGGQWLTVRVRVGKFVNLYTVTAEDDGFGLSVEWSHLTDPRRDYVCQVDDKGRAVRCDCPSRFRCKHRDVSEALVAAGELKIV